MCLNSLIKTLFTAHHVTGREWQGMSIIAKIKRLFILVWPIHSSFFLNVQLFFCSTRLLMKSLFFPKERFSRKLSPSMLNVSFVWIEKVFLSCLMLCLPTRWWVKDWLGWINASEYPMVWCGAILCLKHHYRYYKTLTRAWRAYEYNMKETSFSDFKLKVSTTQYQAMGYNVKKSHQRLLLYNTNIAVLHCSAEIRCSRRALESGKNPVSLLEEYNIEITFILE